MYNGLRDVKYVVPASYKILYSSLYKDGCRSA